MADWAAPALDVLWRNGLAAIPLVLIAAAASRLLPCLPATRHTIWVTVLVWLVLSPLLPSAPRVMPGGGAADAGALIGPTSHQEPGAVRRPSNDAFRIIPATTPTANQISRANRTTPIRAVDDTGREPSTVKRKKPAGNTTHTDAAERRNPLREPTSRVESNRTPSSPRSAARAVVLPPEKLARAAGPAGPLFCANGETQEGLKDYCDATEPGDATDVSSRHAADVMRTPVSRVLADVSSPPQPQPKDNASSPILTPTPVVPIHASGEWPEWVAGVAAVRDVVAQLPTLPRKVWLSGTAVLLAFGIARIVRFRRVLRTGLPAPLAVRTLVESACENLGVKRVPQTLMVEGRVSPMVWCGLRPRLIFPTQLWHQLDDPGRRAVVFHELAHIRRCDHRVTWIESIIGSLYWWHPLVWWVRSRLHAEAENCCDAWVTTLMPQTRRAYATALIRTRQYLSESDRPMPAMGIGITTGRARRFARRLTMVMTGSVRPRLSMSGFTLAVLIAAGGWIASPAKSCPKEAGANDGDEKAPRAAAVAVTAGSVSANEAKMPAPAVAPVDKRAMAIPAIGTIEPAAVIQVSDRGDQAAKARRLAELRAELDRLGKKIERISEALAEHDQNGGKNADDDGDDDNDAAPAPPPPPHGMHVPHAPRAPRPPSPPRALAPRTPMPPMPPQPPMPAMQPMPTRPPASAHGPGATPKPGQSLADVSGEETEWRTYKLSEGKLEAFTQLVSRSDVPILVRPRPEGIEIQATERQHRVIDAFLRIIDPSQERGTDGWGTYDFDFNFDFGKLPGYAAAFARGAGASMGVGCGGPCAKGCNHDCERCRMAAELKAMAKEIKAKAKVEVNELRAKTQGEAERIRARVREEVDRARERLHRHARDARSEARDHHDVIEAIERQSSALTEVAESYREQAERMLERAGAVGEKVSEGDGSAASADAYQVHIDALQNSAEELARQSEELRSQAEELQNKARAVEEDARGLDEHADDLDHRADAVEEAVESIDDVTPTPELVNSVVALISGIEQMVTPATMEAVERAVSAMSVMPRVDFAAPSPADDDEIAAEEPGNEPAVAPGSEDTDERLGAAAGAPNGDHDDDSDDDGK